MNKKIAMLISITAVLLLMPLAVAASEISVEVHGTRIDFGGQPPAIVDGRTLVPVRGVFEELGFDVDWDGDTRTVILSRDVGTVGVYILEIPIDSPTFTRYSFHGHDNETVTHSLEVPAQIIGGRTMLPIREPLESIGYHLGWDNATRTVLVGSAPFASAPATPVAAPPEPPAPPTPPATASELDGRWLNVPPGTLTIDDPNLPGMRFYFEGNRFTAVHYFYSFYNIVSRSFENSRIGFSISPQGENNPPTFQPAPFTQMPWVRFQAREFVHDRGCAVEQIPSTNLWRVTTTGTFELIMHGEGWAGHTTTFTFADGSTFTQTGALTHGNVSNFIIAGRSFIRA
jgi:hypothetical protein